MLYHQALAVFIALEEDLANAAIARRRTLSCDIPTRVDAHVGILTIRSSALGVLSYIAPDGATELSREEFLAAYVIPHAERLDALHRARLNARSARKNIRSIAQARRRYVISAPVAASVPSKITPLQCVSTHANEVSDTIPAPPSNARRIDEPPPSGSRSSSMG